MRTVRSAGGRRRYDALPVLSTTGYCVCLAKGVPSFGDGDDGVGNLPSNLRKLLRAIRKDGSVEVYERVDLRAWTSVGVGGYGDLLIRCSTASSVHQTLDLLAAHGVRWLVIGAGSRVVAPDQGFRTPLLNLTGELGRWTLASDSAEAGAGAKLAQVAGSVARAGLIGMENLMRAPGSVGGALRSAAGRDPGPFHDLVEWFEVERPGVGGSRYVVAGRKGPVWPDLDWERSVISKVRFRLPADGTNRGRSGGGPMRTWGVQRVRAGAFVFHDPPGGSASDLLERADCAALRVGGARVSEHTANAIVATRVCSATDVITLCRIMRDRVQDRCGVGLEPRLCFLDQFGRPFDLES